MESLSALRSGIEAYNQAYDNAMERIKAQNRDASNLAMETLKWITHAIRPLEIQELREALAVKLGTRELDRYNIPDIRDIVSVCAGLVMVDENSDSIRLAHYTTQVYFKTNQDSLFPNAQAMLAQTCVTYLCFDIFDSGFCQNRKDFAARRQHYALYKYSSKYWGLHARGTEIESASLTLEFLRNGHKVSASAQAFIEKYRPWLSMWLGPSLSSSGPSYCSSYYDVASESRGSRNDGYEANGSKWGSDWDDRTEQESLVNHTPEEPSSLDDIPIPDVPSVDEISRYSCQTSPLNIHVITGLHLAAHFGLSETVDQLLNSKQNPDAIDHDGYTPVHWALRARQSIVAQKLVRNGASLELRDKTGRTPLTWAIIDADLDVVELLLKNGADLESRDQTGRAPLSWAVTDARLDTIEILLQSGADLESRDETGRTPLSWAITTGDRGVVELLLEKGADMNA